MSASSINNTPSYINLPSRVERINSIDNRITANNRQIANLENQITAQKEVSSVIREKIAINEKRIVAQQEVSTTLREMITNNTDSINITKELIGNNEKSIEFLQETQVLDIEQRDLLQKCIDIIEKMLAIVMKNPSKYEGMSLKDFSKIPEIITTKLKDYPQENRNDLINVASKVIDNSLEKKSLANLEQKIDLVFSKEILAKIDKFDKSPVSIYRTNQNLYNKHYFTNIKKYSF